MPFTLALVGRPNVGKSTLFNRLVGKKLALVDDRPGVTRDRRAGDARLADLDFTVIDTAGLEEAEQGSLTARMREQTEAAIADADCVLFLIDARAGITPDDRHFAEIVRRSTKPVIVGANKAEGKAAEPGILEAYELGFGEPVPLSAEHGEGMGALYDVLQPMVDAAVEEDRLNAMPDIHEADQPESDEDGSDEAGEGEDDGEGEAERSNRAVRIAIVGRPNAGKSTLINAMLGEERLLTGPEAGITRDSIGLDWEWRGRKIKVFDTAGLRKRARIEDKVEKLAAADAIRAVKFAEVVVVLLDATIPFEKQDLTIVDLCEREGRAVVIGLNKWDLIETRGATLSRLKEDATRLLPQIRGCPIVPLSGLSGQGIDRLMEAVMQIHAVWNRRVPTSKINRWLSGVLQSHPPPAVSGRRIKIRYMTQPKSRPPHFALFGNQLDALPESYKRYLVNSIRETFDLPGVPIRMTIRTTENPFDKDRSSR
ncbi:ribosome biogenesis GTPase Der [Rhabdaerophilum sp. SD176]|uniref:ribosome biogenesis GTPase Der n=1 Tax=Rhabdaerophilum sp. SD176 TaxID=2983548 RepID=UPI0024DF95C6|nr:ribosome biogenesis GTPase Der [Rhabdaerophilum sp. SD176]